MSFSGSAALCSIYLFRSISSELQVFYLNMSYAWKFSSSGETSAGKSSVINLILGEEILPSAVLSTTSTIFELKYDKTPMVVIHFKDSPEPFCPEADN